MATNIDLNQKDLNGVSIQDSIDKNNALMASNVISSATMAPVATVTIPPLPTDTNNYNGIIASGSTLIPPPVTEDPNKGLKDYAALLGEPPSIADAYNTAYNDTGIQEKQKTVNDLSAQLASITAEGQQANLQLEQNAGGKDVTTQFLGRQQQEVSRQTAIKSLPVQAALAAAQGNLTLATDKLNTLFKLKSDDITNKYNYKKDLLSKYYDNMTAAQKVKADALQKENDRVYNLKIDQMNNAQTVANGILDTQPQLSAQISAIDWVKDKNALTKYNDLLKQVKAKATTPTSGYIRLQDITNGKKFVTDNPNASYQDLYDNLKLNTNLDDGDIKSLLTGKTNTKLNRTTIASLFGVTDDDTKTGWFGTGKSNKDKLNEIVANIKKYQDIGYSDAEILKLMK